MSVTTNTLARSARASGLKLSAALGLILLFGGVPALAATAFSPPIDAVASSNPADAAFEALAKAYEAQVKADDPGTDDEDSGVVSDRVPDVSPAAEARREATARTYLAKLSALDPSKLSPETRVNYAVLRRSLTMRVDGAAFDDNRLAFTNEGAAGTYFGYVGRTTVIKNLADAEAWVRRLGKARSYYDQVLDNARRGLKTGFVQPQSTVENALKVARNEAALSEDIDPMLAPLKNLPSTISATDQARLRAEASRIVTDQIRPARQQWVTFLEKDYAPKARKALGVGSLPGGKAYYAYLARSFTTTPLTPDEIHEIGQKEVARIRSEMDVEMKASGLKGTFPEFLTFLRTDPQFYAKSREELLMRAAWLSKQADDQMPRLFKTLPRLPYGVRPVPHEIEETYTTGRYNGGSYEGGVAGGYIVNTGKLDQRPLYELPALTLHEAVPGHHHQIALQQELKDLPRYRRNAEVTAYVEGWGLYAEYLGYEMGLYKTPYERFGRLSYEMWRACRLVADTGIHWKGWSIEQARACFRDNSALAPHNIETELQRYIAWPGQALAYKIGEIKIRELRRLAERELGDQFDVRTFHDALLLTGPLPLDLVDANIREWIAAQKSARP